MSLDTGVLHGNSFAKEDAAFFQRILLFGLFELATQASDLLLVAGELSITRKNISSSQTSATLGLPVMVFWQIWAPDSADRLMFGGDLLIGGYASRVFVHRLFTMGSTPLWNPYQLGGMPLLGDVQVAPYYLPNLLLDILYRGRGLPYLAVEFLVIAHYSLGAIFLYAYLRGLGVQPAAALIGALPTFC